MQSSIVHANKDEKRIPDTGREYDTSNSGGIMNTHDGSLDVTKVLIKG